MTKMLSKIFKLQIVPLIYERYLLHYPMGGLHDTSENLHTQLSIPPGGMVHVYSRPMN